MRTNETHHKANLRARLTPMVDGIMMANGSLSARIARVKICAFKFN